MLEIREIAYQSTEYLTELDLRNRVLRLPMGLNLMEENLEKEQSDVHFGAFENNKLKGVLVLTPLNNSTLKMRQVAIDFDFQGKGVGQELVRFSEKFATESGFGEMCLHARKTAVAFYLKLGYQLIGDEFVEIGIPHIKMNKILVAFQK